MREPLREARLNSRTVLATTTLASGSLIELGSALQLRFTIPHPLCASARLDVVSRHQTRPSTDAILLMAATDLHQQGRLPHAAIVATVMSNMGLEIALRDQGIAMTRCAVGDKYVMEEMARQGLALGGEQSGHIIFADHLFTGDGMATALHVLRIMAASGSELAELAAPMVSYPQVLVNVRVRAKTDLLTVPDIADAVRRVESSLDGQGRLLVRYSGTEPLLRIMIEGKDDGTIRAWADEIASAVRAHLT